MRGVERLRAWCEGYSLHAGVVIAEHDRAALERLYVGRPERASPGEGYPAAHVGEQARTVEAALDLSNPASPYPREQPGDR